MGVVEKAEKSQSNRGGSGFLRGPVGEPSYVQEEEVRKAQSKRSGER